MSQNTCEYFNKGYCKQKDKCTKTHPLKECDGDCNDKKTCPKRHRVPWKNLKKCEFYASKSCEFLHVEHIREETKEDGVDIKDTINTTKNSVKKIEENIVSLNSQYMDMVTKISDIEAKHKVAD